MLLQQTSSLVWHIRYARAWRPLLLAAESVARTLGEDDWTWTTAWLLASLRSCWNKICFEITTFENVQLIFSNLIMWLLFISSLNHNGSLTNLCHSFLNKMVIAPYFTIDSQSNLELFFRTKIFQRLTLLLGIWNIRIRSGKWTQCLTPSPQSSRRLSRRSWGSAPRNGWTPRQMKDQQNLQDLSPRTTPHPDRDFPQLSGNLLYSTIRVQEYLRARPLIYRVFF